MKKDPPDKPPVEPPPGEDYDPHLYRNRPAPTTNKETFIHLLKGCFGTGILAMPEGFKNGGMWCSMMSTLLIGALCTYSFHVLVRSQYIICKRRRVALLKYPESMRAACEDGPDCLKKFAPHAAILTNFFLIFYQIGSCCVYVVFVGANLKMVFDEYTSKPVSLITYQLATVIPFMAILSIRNLKILAPFSMVANAFTLVTYGVVFYYMLQDLPNFSDRPAFGTVLGYPRYFGTMMFAVMPVGVMVSIENNMKTPKGLLPTFGVLNVGMAFVTLTYFLFGLLGYWRYGDDIEPSITLNFPPSEILGQSVNLMYAIAIYISYGLQGYVGVQIIWEDYMAKRLENSNKQLVWEYGMRYSIVFISFFLGMTIPLLGLFISLVGAFCLSALGIVFPALMEICVLSPDGFGPCKIIFLKDLALIIVGLFALGSGSYSSIYEIVVSLTQDKEE